MFDIGYWILDARYWMGGMIQDSGCNIQGNSGMEGVKHPTSNGQLARGEQALV